jgi:hypothetical protein
MIFEIAEDIDLFASPNKSLQPTGLSLGEPRVKCMIQVVFRYDP